MGDLEQAQASLGRAVARARAGEDPVLAAQAREKGEQFANLLSGLVRMGHVHAASNQAFDQPSADLKRALDALLELLGTLNLVAVEDQVYLNDVRLKVHAEGVQKGLGAELARHNVGGLTIHRPLSVEQVRALVTELGQRPAAESPRTALHDRLKELGIEGIDLVGQQRFRLADEARPAGGVGAEATGVIERLVRETEQAWDAVAAGREPNMLALRRLVAEVLQADPASEALWIIEVGTATSHGWHAWKVAQYTLLLARAIGLRANVQQDYGVAALLHDLGYVTPGATRDGHPMRGARILLKQLGYHEAKVRRLDAVLHHHKRFNAQLPLVARVVRIAEDFDTMIRPGGGGRTPAEALTHLAGAASQQLIDPVLTQVFINTMGAYPPGTFLALQDGRVAQSVGIARSAELFAKPRVQIVRRADGGMPLTTEFVDLAVEGIVRGALRPKVAASSASGIIPRPS